MYLYENVEHSAPLAPNGFRPLGRPGGRAAKGPEKSESS